MIRTLAELSGYAYSKSDNTVWVNLYGSNTLETKLNDNTLRLSQETNYPWDGKVRIAVNEWDGGEFTLKLRIPGWSEDTTLQVNEQAIDVTGSGTFTEITRTWKAGDSIQIEFPMPAVLLESHPLVEETRNQIAVKRGPIVYCLESVDLPKEVRFDSVAMPASTQFVATFEPEILGGVTTLAGEFVLRDAENWSSLYRKIEADQGKRFEAKLIPYFAWGNRGKSQMSVWLPRD